MTIHAEQMADAASKVDRLPKWAQEYVRTLEGRAERAEMQLTEAMKGPADSNVFRVWGLRGDDQPIGKNCDIRFQIGDNYRESISVRASSNYPGSLLVQGDRSFVIEPHSSNLVFVKLERR